MRNIETLTTKTGPDDAGLNILLTEARLCLSALRFPDM